MQICKTDRRTVEAARISCLALAAAMWAGIVCGQGSVALPVPQPAPGASGQLPMLPPPGQISPMPATETRLAGGELRVQIRDITSVEGNRSNHLHSVGIVTGLNGTGGKSAATMQLLQNYLKNHGILPSQVTSKSVAMVEVSAELPISARCGEQITVDVSVMDDATDLKGGQLLMLPLYGADGEVYAVARGAILNSGFSVRGDAGSVSKNHPTTAKAKAVVEKVVCADSHYDPSKLTLLLTNKDSLTATRIASSINSILPGHARSLDVGAVEVRVPEDYWNSRNDFISLIGSLTVVPNIPARVVINQKTGTIVIGHRVRLSRVVFANDNLIVTTSENPSVSQPNPFSGGNTTTVPRTEITAVEEGGRFNLLSEGIEVGEFAAALNGMGVTPQDLILLFQTLESSGALHAELVIE